MEYKDLRYPIVEIFDSIQGEGCHLGKSATFVRFAGCNLNCPWCDTEWNKAKEKLTLDELISRINFDLSMVVFTGGEPTLQQLKPIFMAIQERKRGHLMAIETNGTADLHELQLTFDSLWVTCSPKPETHWAFKCIPNEIKYVIDDKIKEKNIVAPWHGCPVWLQPQGYDMQASWAKCFELAMSHPEWRVGVQLHKIMEVR